jgi:formylglycine-generating enzyme required for sulfatase activity
MEWSIPLSCPKVLIHLALVGALAVSVISDLGAQSKVRPAVEPGSGAGFRDCPNCPEMVVVSVGTFTMGSESPQHQVTIAKPFAVSKFPVTFAQWDACVDGGGCNGYRPDDKGWGREDRPVINVCWSDAKAYIAWLSAKTGPSYRLLSEAERE